MRVESVTAHAFGPFRDERLDLAPGFTVVAGPNEAGKSTWHAALRAAICGLPRRRGRATTSEQEFAELHRPWDGANGWAVSARIALDDGRCIEVRQDLAEKVDSAAIELPIGRTVTASLLNEGSPDASRLLGLDRDAFAATVCVDQADLLGVTRAAGVLRERLERAVATRGSDATASEALDRLRRFRSERVGADRAGAVRPLRRAIEQRDEAARALEEARRCHTEYLRLAADADEARAAHAGALLELRRADARVAREEADAARRLAERVGELAARHGEEPPALPARDVVADEVAAALAAWSARPAVPRLDGPTTADLEAQIAHLPVVPPGDVAVDPEVRARHDAWQAARQAAALLGEAPAVVPVPVPGLGSAELSGLAADLDAAVPLPPPALDGARQDAETRRRSAGARSRTSVAILAVSLVAAVAGLLAGIVVLGALGVIAAAASLAAWLAVRRAASLAADDLHRADAARAPIDLAAAAARARRSEAVARLTAAGVLNATPQAVRTLASQAGQAEASARARDEWEERAAVAAARVAAAAAALRDTLGARNEQDRANADAGPAAVCGATTVPSGEPGSDLIAQDPEAAFRAYEAACAERAAIAAAASRRGSLDAALSIRRQAEAQAADAERSLAAAAKGIRAAAERAGCARPAESEEEAVAALQAWRQRRAADLEAASSARAEWEQLQALLGGRPVESVEADARRAVENAERHEAEVMSMADGRDAAPNAGHGASAGVPAGRAAAAAGRAAAAAGAATQSTDGSGADERARVTPERLRALEDEERRLRDTARSLAGRAEERAAGLPGVAEAEEALERAESELERVRRLDGTLAATIELLSRAEERAHRTVAPVLATAVRERLSEVTSGRYDDVAVDPATLDVTVRERATGLWRHAQRLSHGAREQIYLLLRAAMAQHLVTEPEAAPLLLDEVTAQADERRKVAILAVLHAISRERQVVLFTHDRDVLEWARVHLDGDRDRLVELAGR